MFIQLFKFGIVGVINNVITTLIYFILITVSVDPNIAYCIGYIAGAINSYFFNNYWVFTAKDNSKEVLVKFIIVNLITLGLSSGLLAIFMYKLNISKKFAQLFVIPFTMLINYALNKFWTFNKGGNSK